MSRPPPAPRKCSDEAALDALDRHRAGGVVRVLAADLGLSECGLRRRWIRMGLVTPTPARPLTGRELAAAQAAVHAGASLYSAARALDRSPSQLRRYLHRRGWRGQAGSAPTRQARDRVVMGKLLDGEPWRKIIAALDEPGCLRAARNRLLQGVLRYCAREGLPVPPAARLGLGVADGG